MLIISSVQFRLIAGRSTADEKHRSEYYSPLVLDTPTKHNHTCENMCVHAQPIITRQYG